MQGISNSIGKDNGGSGEGKRYVPDWDNIINLTSSDNPFTCPSDGWIGEGENTDGGSVSFISNLAPNYHNGTFSYSIQIGQLIRVQQGEILTTEHPEWIEPVNIIFVPEK